MSAPNTPRWIFLSPEKLVAERRHVARGVELNIFVSPHDVPDAVRGYFDQRIGRFVIELRYLTEEKWQAKQGDQFLTLRVGRDSKRLLGIEIDVRALNTHAVGLRLHPPQMITEAIDKLAMEPSLARREDNYRIVNEVISDRRKELFEGLAAVG